MDNVFSRISRDKKNGISTRAEYVGFVTSLFAFISHILFLSAFVYIRVMPMVYFNIFSVLFFAVIFFTFRKRDSYLVTYILSSIEVTAHQITAEYFIGYQSAFHFYILLMAFISALMLENKTILSIVFASICSLCFLAIEIHMPFHNPIYIVPSDILRIIREVNILFTLFVIVLIVYTFTLTVSHAEQRAEIQYSRADRMLNNILPEFIIQKIKSGNYSGTIANTYPDAGILILDIVNFTEYSSQLDSSSVITILSTLFSQFDELLDKYHVEKIKTHGDSYIAVSGIPEITSDSYRNLAHLALKMMELTEEFNQKHHSSFQFRIGLHCGTIVAGVIGQKRISYDLWGPSVNLAVMINSTDVPGRIQVSKEMYAKLKDNFFLDERAPIPVKNFGMRTNYFLKGEKY